MKRIVLAMSGGVDSSVSAYLLQREGWEVTGVTLDLWRGTGGADDAAEVPCLPAAEDARQVCEELGIAHRVIDCRDEFRRAIIQEFCEEYFRGRTPNPCIRCNPHIKFKCLVAYARRIGADAIATGHYAIVEHRARGRFLIRKGKDPAKEQSYVLHGLSQAQLALCRFPLGTWEKRSVRALARELGLQTHNKPDSQEVCFVPGDDYGRFIENVLPGRARPGRIMDTSGRQLGRHSGVHLFTIGQRRGLGIAVGEPRYVVDINPETATVVVASREETYRSRFLVRGINWIALEAPAEPFHAQVKIRYTHDPAPARVEPSDEGRAATVTFEKPQHAITPGQAAVFYDEDLVLGGGTIWESSG